MLALAPLGSQFARSLQRVPSQLFMLAAVGVGLLTQLLLDGWPAVAGYAVAAGLFVQATAQRSARPTGLRLAPSAALAGFGVVVAVAVSLMVKRADSWPAGSPVWSVALLAWLAAVAAYALAWFSPRAAASALRAWHAHRVELLAAGAVVVVAFLARAWALDDYPRTFGGDDAMAALHARSVLEGRPSTPFGASQIGSGKFPNLYFWAQAAVMWFAGDTVAGARMLPALAGTATVVGLYLLARQWFGRVCALVAAAMLALFPHHLFWSRSPLNNGPDALVFVVVLLCSTRALATGRPIYFALAGLSLGLGQYGYQSSRVLLGVVPLLVVREVVADRGWLGRNWTSLLIMAGGLVVAYLPQVTYFVDHPSDYVSRFNQISIFQSGWLAAESQRSGRSAVELVFEQLRRTFLVFYTEPPKWFFEPGRPLLDPLSSVFFTFGAVLALFGLRQRAALALLGTLFALLVSVAMTDMPPNGARLAGMAPLVVLVVALGLVKTADILAAGRARATWAIAAPVALGIAAFGGHFYFVQYAGIANYDFPNGEGATEFAYYMREHPRSTRFVFLAQPRMSCTTHATLRFIAPGRECVDVPPEGDTRPRPELRDGDVVMALPERRHEAERIVAGRPAYQAVEILRPGRAETLLFAFTPQGSGP